MIGSYRTLSLRRPGRNRLGDAGLTPCHERGSMTIFVALMVVPVVLMAALAFDGGLILTERRSALDAAQNIALAGSQAVDATAIREGQVTLGTGEVLAAIDAYLADVGDVGTVILVPVAGSTEVRVTVSREVDLQLLSIAGIGPKTVTATASSRISRGVEAADT